MSNQNSPRNRKIKITLVPQNENDDVKLLQTVKQHLQNTDFFHESKPQSNRSKQADSEKSFALEQQETKFKINLGIVLFEKHTKNITAKQDFKSKASVFAELRKKFLSTLKKYSGFMLRAGLSLYGHLLGKDKETTK